MDPIAVPRANNDGKNSPLVPPRLPAFMSSVFDLKPITGNPSREEVRLVHESIRALNNFLHTPEVRDTDLPMELSQHLFDIQMVCYRQRYPVNVLPSDAVYDPPSLPSYIPVELKSITGPPTNEEFTSVQAALRISEGYAGAPSIFDPDLHAELSQHLFDIQLARHVQRSIVNRFTAPIQAPRPPNDTDADGATLNPGRHGSPDRAPLGTVELTEPLDQQPNTPNRPTEHQTSDEANNLRKTNELIIEVRDILKTMNRVLVGSQNSLARGFNSSSHHNVGYDLGAHTLVNENGELPEACGLPTFEQVHSRPTLPARSLPEDVIARYLQFYKIGTEMLEGGGEPKIKSSMLENAKNLLALHLSSRWG